MKNGYYIAWNLLTHAWEVVKVWNDGVYKCGQDDRFGIYEMSHYQKIELPEENPK